MEDAFDVAVRALTSTHPVRHRSADVPSAPPAAASVPVAHQVTRRDSRTTRRPRRSVRRMAAASVTVGAVLAVGLLAVGTTLPTGAVAAPNAAASSVDAVAAATGGGDAGIQAYVASGGAAAADNMSLDRVGGFAASVSVHASSAGTAASSTTTVSGATGAAAQQAGTIGITDFSNAVFTNNRACPVQWPFAVGVPISWGFGPRPGEFHEGVDFTPGAGAHIQAIAAGTVVVAQPSYYGYGGAVMIDHVIDGQKVASLYGHLEAGSIQVHVGEQVQVGQYIGNTGSTGYAFGANTHFEIRQNDVTPINPIPWLQAHNQC